MDLLEKILKNNYDWALHRMDVLCKLGTVEDIEDADSIRKNLKNGFILRIIIMILFH